MYIEWEKKNVNRRIEGQQFFIKNRKNEKQVDMGIKSSEFNTQKEKLGTTGNKRYDVDL